MPLSLAPDAVRELTQHIWHGKANWLSRDDPVQWEILNQVELASWKSLTEHRVVALNRGGHAAKASGIVLGFNDATFQSLYHFTTGGPVEDPRLTTLPPYGLDH